MRILSTETQIATDVQLHLARPSGGDEGDRFVIEIEDKASHLLIGKISISLDEIGNLISNRLTKGTAKFYTGGVNNIGKIRLVQQITFKFTEDEVQSIRESFEQKIRDFEAEYPGWLVDDRVYNSNRINLKTREYSNRMVTWKFAHEVPQHILDEDIDG